MTDSITEYLEAEERRLRALWPADRQKFLPPFDKPLVARVSELLRLAAYAPKPEA